MTFVLIIFIKKENFQWIDFDLGPTLTTSPTTSSKQCWMPSGDSVSSSQSKLFPSSSINSRSFQESSVPCDTNSKSRGSESNVVSCSTLTKTVKEAMNKGQLSTTNSNPTKSAYHGTTLSTKDLNHLSPQSMWFKCIEYFLTWKIKYYKKTDLHYVRWCVITI